MKLTLFCNYLKNNLSKFSICLIFITVAYYSYNNRLRNELWKNVINSDGRGYYAYLPAAFIYYDWTWEFTYKIEKEHYQNSNGPYYLNNINGFNVNQYYAGTSVLIAPFFSLACLFSSLAGYPINGYSLPFQYSVAIAGIFYFILGLVFIRKLLTAFRISEVASSITLLAIGIGTNVFYYAAIEPSMSHVYSFSLISMFCFYSKKFFEDFSTKNMLFISVIAIFIFIVRPSNIVVLLALPFFAQNFRHFISTLRFALSKRKTIVCIIIIACVLIGIQCTAYYLQSGSLFVYSYSNAKFNFSDPHFFELLFGYKKGLFIYTPVLLFSLFGILPLFKHNLFQAGCWILFFIANTYVLSSWGCWWYGGSFGMRAYIDFFPLFAVPLAFLLNEINSIGKIILTCIFSLLIYIHFIQIYQYNNFILHWDSMDKEKYWRLFLKTDAHYSGLLWNNPDAEMPVKGDAIYESENNFETESKDWASNSTLVTHQNAPSGKYVSQIDKKKIYSACFHLTIDSALVQKKLAVNASALVSFAGNLSGAKLVISVERGGSGSVLWNTKTIHSEDQQWMYVQFRSLLPSVQQGDEIRVYFLNNGENFVLVDDFRVKVFEVQ